MELNKRTIIYLGFLIFFWLVSNLMLVVSIFGVPVSPNTQGILCLVVIGMSSVIFLPAKYRRWLNILNI